MDRCHSRSFQGLPTGPDHRRRFLGFVPNGKNNLMLKYRREKGTMKQFFTIDWCETSKNIAVILPAAHGNAVYWSFPSQHRCTSEIALSSAVPCPWYTKSAF